MNDDTLQSHNRGFMWRGLEFGFWSRVEERN